MQIEGRAYLDIETSFSNSLTVVGIFRPDRSRFIQLVGEFATPENLLDALDGAEALITYNGNRFDLPVLNNSLGVDLFQLFHSHDLMYDCWRCGLKGGLKAVEGRLGIERTIFGIGADDPRVLWEKFRRRGDVDSLERLLDYNRQDTLNLFHLEEKLFNLPSRGSVTSFIESYLRLV
ncbi:MAG: ribonuclease H-like domain-containing protein [Actinobacteria bacterium]|nr:ribonuclease H-like domain-containing protein [Actinomycetota bacterium]